MGNKKEANIVLKNKFRDTGYTGVIFSILIVDKIELRRIYKKARCVEIEMFSIAILKVGRLTANFF